MSRFYNYPEAEVLQSDDVFLIDGETDGTRKIPANKMADFFGEQVPTDKTLAVTNMAADAKVVGDEIGELKSALRDVDGYFDKCINLFNPNDTDLVENYKLNNDGTTTAETGKFVSGFIPVKPGQTFCAHYPTGIYGAASTIVFYNSNKERIGYSNPTRTTDANERAYLKYSMPSDAIAVYMRMTGLMYNGVPGGAFYMYVYANEMPAIYVPYTDNVTLSDDVIVPFENVDEVMINKSATDFINTSKINLVDFSKMTLGITTSSNSNGDIDTSGNYGTNWETTDYIEVEPGETYALCIFQGVNYGTSFTGIPCYDKNKNFVARVKQSGGSVAVIASGVTITIPTNTSAPVKYIRTSYYTSYIQNPKRWWLCQIFKASAWPSDLFIPYDDSEQIGGVRLDNAISRIYNPLFNKSAIWNGDSICAADNDTVEGGWPGRIASKNRMWFRNYAVAGGTIAENTGSTVHSVSGTLDTMISDSPDADYVIIEGGTNDADILGSEGIGVFDADDFTAEYITALDKNTFSGALESIFYRLVTQMKGSHIGYLIPQKMGHTEVLVERRRDYFDRAVEICKKWGIPYLDLWDGLYLNWRLATHWDQTKTSAENETAGNPYMDGQHLTTHGYAIESPIIGEWMKTI